MNYLNKMSRSVIRHSFDIAVIIIERFSNTAKQEQQLDELRSYEEGSLGNRLQFVWTKNSLHWFLILRVTT